MPYQALVAVFFGPNGRSQRPKNSRTPQCFKAPANAMAVFNKAVEVLKKIELFVNLFV